MGPMLRAVPVETITFQTTEPELATMSRDDLLVLVNNAKTWPTGKNPLADAILKEWNGRVKYHKAEALKVEGSNYVSPEFREEVIEALMGEGCTLIQATNRTRDQARLFAEAAALRMM